MSIHPGNLNANTDAPSRAVAPRVPEAALPVEMDHGRVLIRGRRYATFVSETNAARCASALMTLEALGLLDTVKVPQDVVRDMLEASIAALKQPTEEA